MLIREMTEVDIPALKAFTDKWIGKDYYDEGELKKALSYSHGCSLVAEEDGEFLGIRLTYAPGTWVDEQRGITPENWKVEKESAAYFKSLFISEKAQGKGLGGELSSQSIERLKERGAKAILCHSWLESPNNSSQRYLQKMGFVSVREWPKYWYPIDYDCTRCGEGQKCVCTAIEMIKYI